MSKKIDFSFSGGFPLDETALDKMQQASVEFFKSIIAYIGVPEVGNYILSGVTVTGTSISSGWVYMDGDIIPFPAMTGTTGLTTKLLKQTVGESVSFEDGGNHPVYITSSVVVDASGVELSTFERVNGIPVLPTNIVIDPADLTNTPPDKTVLERIIELEKKTAIFVADGVVFPWRKDKSLIPVGFQEVIDLRGKTVFGMDVTLNPDGSYKNPEFSPVTAGQNDPGRSGGNKNHILTKDELPNYNLEYHVGNETVTGGPVNIRSSNAGGSYTNLIPSGGNDQPFSILPPFETVIFIEYIG